MKGLVIFGATTLARLAHYYATQELGLAVQGFVVDDDFHRQDSFLALPVWPWSTFVRSHGPGETAIHVAVGYRVMRGRRAAFELVRAAGYELASIVSPASHVASDVRMGSNNFIMPGAVLETGVSLGSNNVVWSNATVCHDGVVGSHNFLAANTTVGGGCAIGDCNFLGFSSVVLQGVRIGNETLVGAQALVRHDTQDLTRYQGVPARAAGRVSPDLGIRVD